VGVPFDLQKRVQDVHGQGEGKYFPFSTFRLPDCPYETLTTFFCIGPVQRKENRKSGAPSGSGETRGGVRRSATGERTERAHGAVHFEGKRTQGKA
jgi:hypothetical protein